MLFYVRAQLFVKVGARHRALLFWTHCLGHGPSGLVWVKLSERRKSLSLVQGQSPCMGSGVPRSQLFVKMGARAPVLYGVSNTVSDILMVSLTSVSLYTRLTSRLDLSL